MPFVVKLTKENKKIENYKMDPNLSVFCSVDKKVDKSQIGRVEESLDTICTKIQRLLVWLQSTVSHFTPFDKSPHFLYNFSNHNALG